MTEGNLIADKIDQAEMLSAADLAHIDDTPDMQDDPLASELVLLPPNDTGNGQRLLRRFGEDVRFIREVGPTVWTGTHWDTEGGMEHALKLAQRTAAAIRNEAFKLERRADESDANFATRRKRHVQWGITSGNDGRLKAMINQAAPHATDTPQDYDRDPMTLNVANGTLRFDVHAAKDGRDPVSFHEHNRMERHARIGSVVYDPQADAPIFRQFLSVVQPVPMLARFLQIWTGYCLTGLTTEQKLVFFYGSGSNGKSTFVDVIAEMLNSYSSSLRFESLAGDNARRGDAATPDLARLPGVRFLRAAEPEQGMRFREAEIKAITGGEPMLVRHLQKGFFEFKPVFKLILSGNHKPDIRGLDEGIWRRILLVPWAVTVPQAERDPDLPKKLRGEMSGILNWALDGLRIYLEEGLSIPDDVRAATSDYRAESDPIGDFLRTSTEPVEGGSVAAGKLYDAYCYWARLNGFKPWTGTAFGRALGQKGLAKENGRVRLYTGFVLTPEAEPPSSPAPRDDGIG